MRHSCHVRKVIVLKIPYRQYSFLLLRIREESRHLITQEQLGMETDCCSC